MSHALGHGRFQQPISDGQLAARVRCLIYLRRTGRALWSRAAHRRPGATPGSRGGVNRSLTPDTMLCSRRTGTRAGRELPAAHLASAGKAVVFVTSDVRQQTSHRPNFWRQRSSARVTVEGRAGNSACPTMTGWACPRSSPPTFDEYVVTALQAFAAGDGSRWLPQGLQWMRRHNAYREPRSHLLTSGSVTWAITAWTPTAEDQGSSSLT